VDDQSTLDVLYANARAYVHGHTVGGTNPSLLRAMGAGAPVLAYDCIFNREVCSDTARYFRDPEELAQLLGEAASGRLSKLGPRAQQRAEERYDWDMVTSEYEALLERCGGTNDR